MARQKKIKVVDSEIKQEASMTEENAPLVLDSLETEIDKARQELEATKLAIEEHKKQLKKMSSREVSEEEMIIVKKQVTMGNDRKALQDKIESQKAYDNEKVTGKFINRRAPGQPAKLTYIKYADDPVKWYTFEDGKVYTIPRGFMEQIREHYHTPVFNQTVQAMDPNRPSSAIHDVDTSNKKYDFVPLNF